MISRTAFVFLYLGLIACSQSASPPEPSAASPVAREQASTAPIPPMKTDTPIELNASDLAELSLAARWDTSMVAQADFNSDGLPDEAIVGYIDSGLLLAIDTSRSDGTKERTLFPFGIGHSQDSICIAPAILRVEVAHCSVEGDDLPGCRSTDEPSGLELGDKNADCDPIHLFWNHQQNRMNWWRH